MTSITLKVPDRMAAAAKDYVKAGFFDSPSEVFATALADFVRRNRVDLLERFAREDIAWAKSKARGGACRT
jgi:Arc/MetJ-type ribon-helix-helix transcriptional regulator